MVSFVKYPSIENHYREKFLEYVREAGYDNEQYIVTEKIHGANFSFHTKGKMVRVASRNDLTDGTFYGSQVVIDRFEDAIMDLKNTEYPDAEQISVYGELYGQGIQSGVFYRADKGFIAFDLHVDAEIIPQSVSIELFREYCIPHVPVVEITDSLDEALAISNTFNSLLPNILDPESVCQYETGENNAEGLVIQPFNKVLYLHNDSRVIIKSKTEAFQERKQKKRNKNPGTPNPFVELAEEYVNTARMEAVISKIGEVTQRDFGRVIGDMSKDVAEDMIKDEVLPEDWKKQEDFKLAGKGIQKVVSKFLKEELLPEL